MSAVVHSISQSPRLRIARLVQMLVIRQRLAALDELRTRLPLDDPDRHTLDSDADARFAQLATDHPEACGGTR